MPFSFGMKFIFFILLYLNLCFLDMGELPIIWFLLGEYLQVHTMIHLHLH
jgi:hypothetical protein